MSRDISYLLHIAGHMPKVVTTKHPFMCISEVVGLIHIIRGCDASKAFYSSKADKNLMIKEASEHHQILI